MDKTDVICKLKANNYSFEDKGNQVIVKLRGNILFKYFFELYFENGKITDNKDIIKTIGLGNGKSLKMYAILNIGLGLFIIFLLAVLFFDAYLFSNGGKYFFIMLPLLVLYLLIEYLYCNKRLSKIKKLLNLNE